MADCFAHRGTVFKSLLYKNTCRLEGLILWQLKKSYTKFAKPAQP